MISRYGNQDLKEGRPDLEAAFVFVTPAAWQGMQTRSFHLFQPLSLDSQYSFNILGPFYFTVFIDYSCWSITLWLSSFLYKPNESSGVLCLRITFWNSLCCSKLCTIRIQTPITFTSPTQFLRIWDVNIFRFMVMQILDCKL